jgi:hypothetical protein
LLDPVIPNANKVYQRLCSITHPSSDSINYLFDHNVERNSKLRLELAHDPKAINDFVSEFPDALPAALLMSCTPSLLVLRVLHKFGIHPKLPMLKRVDWDVIPVWAEVKRDLSS